MDVATVRTENANLRKIQQKLLQWDTLAPLTTNQLDFLEQLSELCDVSSKTEVSFTSQRKLQKFVIVLLLNRKYLTTSTVNTKSFSRLNQNHRKMLHNHIVQSNWLASKVKPFTNCKRKPVL